MVENNLTDLKTKIREHKNYQRIMSTFKDISVWDVETCHDEVLGYQNVRGEREPHALRNTPKKKLIQYASEDASYRSRVAYIQATARRISYRVEYLIDTLHSWVLATYSSKLKGTVQIKNAFIASLSTEMTSYLNKLNAVDDCCRIVVEDIDQSQWSRKAVISILEIESRPEGKV